MKPTFVVASLNFERDLTILKDVLNKLEMKTNYKDSHKFAEKGQKAAGWWFYEIYCKPDFMEKVAQLESTNKKIDNERKILEIIQDTLKQNNSTARVRLYKDKPFLVHWWAWLMK
ncbi:MAG TPA: hypothetical protein VJJ25_02565 [Nitrosopumilaceae archaeon]|nr:hypothetical protein [Nitrosopumilaceae archaeon]